MYIINNALKSIWRSKGRNILIGIIVLVISTSACISLSIREAAKTAKETTLDNMSITATISFDRSSAMEDMKNNLMNGGGFDKGNFDFDALMGDTLTYDDYMKYTEALSTGDSYQYTITTSLNATENITPYGESSSSIDTETEEDNSDTENKDNTIPDFPGGMGNMMGGKGDFIFNAQGDFSISGYSSYDAMLTLFGEDGSYSITSGSMFDETSTEYQIVISDELALLNEIEVGDTISLANPNYEEETYNFTVTGIYTNSSSDSGNSMFSRKDPANDMYMNAYALNTLVEASAKLDNKDTNSDGEEESAAITSEISFTYVFATAKNYYKFEEDVYDLGLSTDYTVSSGDLASFENSLEPLNSLSDMAGLFFLVVLIIGAVILIVLNIFNLRERKYEVGVLTAIGMKKHKVAFQFVTELFIVTFITLIIGSAIGTVSSVPVTNTLLKNQIESASKTSNNLNENFGMGAGSDRFEQGGMGGGRPNMNGSSNTNFPGNMPSGGDMMGGMMNDMMDAFGDKMPGAVTDYVDSVSSATNLTVILQMVGMGILLTIISSLAAMITIMRYEPLQILSNRS